MRIVKLTIALFIFCSVVFSSGKDSRQIKKVSGALSAENKACVSADNKTIEQHFAAPPADFRLIQYYMSIDPARQSDDVNSDAIKKFQSFGIGGLQQSVNYKHYLESDEFWKLLAGNIEKARAAGFRSWIHDEQGYPSGMAGGKIVRDNPELESLALIRLNAEETGFVTKEFTQADNITFLRAYITPIAEGILQYHLSQPVPVVNGKVTTGGIAGTWRLSVFGTKVINSNSQAQSTISQFGHLGRYPNLLDKKSTQKYIELTHQRYAKHVPGLSEKVELFYTGETNLQCIPWSSPGTYPLIPWHAELPQVFKDKKGYELWPYLDALFSETDDFSKSVRLHFYQTIGDLFSEYYSKPIVNWCAKNGVNALGHLLLEEYFATHVINYGNFMQVLQDYHVPMCDIPVPGTNWSETLWDFWMPKLVSSAAYLQNKEMVAGLLDPVIMGNSYSDLTPNINRLKRTVNMAVMTGINQFSSWIPLTDFYTPEDFSLFNNYLGRMCLMMRGAKNEATIAMYYPIETFQANYIPGIGGWDSIANYYSPMQLTHNSLAKKMLRNGMDYNYLTAEAVLKASLEKGFLKVGNHRYSVILMPDMEVIPFNVLNKLIECERKGVRVLWVNKVPSLGITNLEHLEVRIKSAGLRQSTDPFTELMKHSPKGFNLNITGSMAHLSVGKFSRNTEKMYVVVNDYGTSLPVKIDSRKVKYVKIYQPGDGSITRIRLPNTINISAYESVIIKEYN